MRPVGDFLTFLFRLLFLYLLWGLCRVGFYFANADIIGAISWSEVPLLLKGAFIFDSASIFYINLPFLLFSLLPFRFRSDARYQKILMWLFVAVNAAGLAINIADILYYPYKLGRIASDDFHFVTGSNFGTLMWGFLMEFWYAVIAWAGLGFLLWYVFRKIRYRPTEIRNNVAYYVSQTAILVITGTFAIVMIRGGTLSRATFPLNLSDAGLYAAPSKTALVQSNPFAVIRTNGISFSYTEYFPEEELDAIFSPVRKPSDSCMKVEGTPNIMLIILESFGSAHIKALSDRFDDDDPGYTPFLDSLIAEGYIFRNAYQNGNRSMDALPSLLASIPSFKHQFLGMSQSNAHYHALPECMKEMGYSTAFFHGAVRQSMSFVAFGRMAGIEHFRSQEDYEAVFGKNDFDGMWGIWDHKFLPYAADMAGELQQPFFATLFTLSSHHPFVLPAGFEARYPEGNIPMHRMIAYSDDALRQMFTRMAGNEWFDDTIFVITGDHGSGADNEKYNKTPYNYSVPLLFYSPGGLIPQGSDDRVAGHIDLMPTLLGILGYDRDHFAFGRDLFADETPPRTVNYVGTFNTITNNRLYMFNKKEFTGLYDYCEDPMHEHNLIADDTDENDDMIWTKAFLQQYYRHIRERSYTVPE